MCRNHKERLFIEMKLMNLEEAWDSEVILNGAKTVGCDGSTSRYVTPKRICEHTKRILNQKFLCKENERTTMNIVAHHDLSYIR
jgi:hypothetical protein